MNIGDLNKEEMADYVIEKYISQGQDKASAIQNALIGIDIALEDLRVSHQVCKEGNLHPHADGLIAGTIMMWTNVKKILKEKL